MDGLVRNPGPDVTGTAFESGGERGGSVLGYSQANSSQPNTVHEYSQFRGQALRGTFNDSGKLTQRGRKNLSCWHLYNFSLCFYISEDFSYILSRYFMTNWFDIFPFVFTLLLSYRPWSTYLRVVIFLLICYCTGDNHCNIVYDWYVWYVQYMNSGKMTD